MKTLKIYGPPGTGKTSYLLQLFEQELKQTKPERIGFLTFTRAARMEALERSGFSEDELPFLRTIHAICYRQLGVTQGQIVKASDLRDLAKQTGLQFRSTHESPWDANYVNFGVAPTKDDLLLQLNHLSRHKMIMLQEAVFKAATDVDYHYAKWFTQVYREWKRAEAILDYTDLLTEYMDHGQPLPVDVLFVDEAQDLSRLQWKVVHKLGANAQRVYLAGDDDQAIFTWAGASADSFIQEYADETRYLDQSYRVPSDIMDIALTVINRVSSRQPKPIKPRPEKGTVGDLAFIDEDALSAKSTLLLFRNHHRGRLLAEKLIDLGHPYLGELSPLSEGYVQRALTGWSELCKGNSISSNQAKAILKYSDCIKPGLEDVIKKEKTKTWVMADLFEDTNDDLNKWEFVLPNLPNISYILKAAQLHEFKDLLEPTTRLMSIHQAKGREADTVILDLEMARKTYDAWFTDAEDEHRVWYVAITRARERLLTVVPEGIMYYQI